HLLQPLREAPARLVAAKLGQVEAVVLELQPDDRAIAALADPADGAGAPEEEPLARPHLERVEAVADEEDRDRGGGERHGEAVEGEVDHLALQLAEAAMGHGGP